eukprot:gene2845-3138_t
MLLPAPVIQGCSAPVPIPQDRSADLAAVAAAANQMTKHVNVGSSYPVAAPGSYAPFLLIDDDDDDDLEGSRVDRAGSSPMLGMVAQDWQSSLTVADVASAGWPPHATTASQAAGRNSASMSSSSANILRGLRQQHQHQQQHHSCRLTSQQPAPDRVSTEVQHEKIMQLIDHQLDHLVRLRQQLRARSAASAAAAASSPPAIGRQISAGVLQPLQVSPQVSPDPPAMQGSIDIGGTTNKIVAGLPRDLSQPSFAHVHMQQQESLSAAGALPPGSHHSAAQTTSQMSSGPENKESHSGALNADAVGSNLTDFVLQQQEEVQRGAAWINAAQQKLQQLLTMRQLQAQLQAEMLQLLPLGQG